MTEDQIGMLAETLGRYAFNVAFFIDIGIVVYRHNKRKKDAEKNGSTQGDTSSINP